MAIWTLSTSVMQKFRVVRQNKQNALVIWTQKCDLVYCQFRWEDVAITAWALVEYIGTFPSVVITEAQYICVA